MSDQDELRLLRDIVARLTERVYRLEQTAQLVRQPFSESPPQEPDPLPPPGVAKTPAGTALPPSPGFSSPHASELRVASVAATPGSLERRIGSQWLSRIGVVAVLVGVSYFLKLAFDNGWVGPGFRVLIGIIAGVGLSWWSERFRRPSSLAFSYSLKSIGIGALYLSLWASFQLYQLIPAAIAFLAMILVTAVTAGMAIVQDAELLAGLALLGGLLTPVLCGSGENHQAVLFAYLLLLSLGAFRLQRVKAWPRILFGAFAGSVVLGGAWFDRYYSNDQFAESLLFFTLLFALFAVAPLYAKLAPARDPSTPQTGLLLAILNAAAYFAALYSQLLTSGASVQPRASGFALGLAAVYLALAVAIDRRVSERPGVERLMPIAHYGLGISFLTVGTALRLHQHWITLAWLLEGSLLFWVGARTAHWKLKLFATVVVALGLLRLLTLDLYDWGQQSLVFNARFATFAIAIAALLWMIDLDSHSADRETDRIAIAVAATMVNLLALLAFSLEIHDFFQLSIHAAPADANGLLHARHALTIARSFSYSALVMFYGAALMWLGFARNSTLLRWQAMLLIAIAVLKVFFVDVSALDHAWRVLSFIILGALLLAVSYAYQRDWLGLQRTHTG